MVVAIQYEQHHQSDQFHIISGCLPSFRQPEPKFGLVNRYRCHEAAYVWQH